MSFEEPTQRVRRPGDAADAPTTALPGPLNLAGRTETAEPGDGANGTTDVLSLDELFDGQPPAAEPENAGHAAAEPAPVEPAPAGPGTVEPGTAGPGTVEQAPTWTAMPVVPVRSEPVTPNGVGAPERPEPAPLGGRVRDDAAAAWEGAVRRTRAWLARDDNGLTLLTALVAVILIIAVAGLS